MKRRSVFVFVLLFALLSGCGLFDKEDVIDTVKTISRAVPKKISFVIPSNMLNSGSSGTTTTASSTNTEGAAYKFLKEYITIANQAATQVDSVISIINSNTNYLFQSDVLGHLNTNSSGNEWYYFNTNQSANYVYLGDITSNGLVTNFYMDWSGAEDQFTGKAIFYANDPLEDMQEGTLLFDYSKSNPTLDIYIKFKSYFTNFRVLLTSLGNGKITLQAKIMGNEPTNTVSPTSWVDTWEIVGYGQTNAEGGGKAWISGTYTNDVEQAYRITNTNDAGLNGLDMLVAYTNKISASLYVYEEYFSANGMTEWKLGSADAHQIFHYSYGDFYTNALSSGMEWTNGTALYGYTTHSEIDLTLTNLEDTWPVAAVGADVDTSTNADGSTNYITNKIYYANTNSKPNSDVSTMLDSLQKLSDGNYPQNSLYPM